MMIIMESNKYKDKKHKLIMKILSREDNNNNKENKLTMPITMNRVNRSNM